MKKFILRGLAVALTVLGFIGFLSVKPVKAAESNVDGFKIKGAAIRESNSDEDLMGLRFTTTMTQKAYNEIVSQYGGQTIRFGTEVTTTAENAHVQNFCYLSTKPTSLEHLPSYATQDESETLEFYAAITFNYVEFKADIERQLINNKELTVGTENYSEVLEACVRKYLQKAYATQLKATSYYQVGEGDSAERYYTTSLVRSMSMVANYYANTPDIDFELDEYFYSKNYFEAGEVKSGYVTGDGSVAVFGLDVAGVTALAYNAEPLTFTNDGELKLDSQEITIPAVGEAITLYAFDANNKVTTLVLESVNEVPGLIRIGNNTVTEAYSISVDSKNTYASVVATNIQSAISAKTGLTLDLVGEDYDGLAIIVKEVEKDSVNLPNGYREYVDENSNLVIECAYSNKFDVASEAGVLNILQAEGFVEFGLDYSFSDIDISKVYYSEFGVVGDGVTNDFLAMKKAHDFANISGQTVMGEANMTYYICETYDSSVGWCQPITIKTDVDWQNATIIIDDNSLEYTATAVEGEEYKTELEFNGDPQNNPIFRILNDASTVTIEDTAQIANLFEGSKLVKEGENKTTKLKTSLGYPALLRVVNGNKRIFKRSGGNANSGYLQSEIIYVDENGNFINSDLFLDVDTITKVEIYRADCAPVTVKNAVIKTLASQVNLRNTNKYRDLNRRGFIVSRANTTLLNLDHQVEGELKRGENYTEAGEYFWFESYSQNYLCIDYAYNLLVKDCWFTGRTYYSDGTYDIAPSYSHTVTFENCNQHNFFKDEANQLANLGKGDNRDIYNICCCWGIMGSKFCKNVTYDGCTLTRFDAHEGMVNGKVINSSVGEISVIGAGELIIENTNIYSTDSGAGYEANEVFGLRTDYGSTWDGTVTVKNCRVINSKSVYDGDGNKLYEASSNGAKFLGQDIAPQKGDAKPTLISQIVNVKHTNNDYGYVGHFPSITVDGLVIDYPADNIYITKPNNVIFTDPAITLRGEIMLDYTANNYPYLPPQFITVRNTAYDIIAPTDNNYFKNTTLTGVVTQKIYSNVVESIRKDYGSFNPGWLNVSLA